MSDDEFQRKQEKARVYSTQLERFELLEIKLKMKSTHDTRLVN